MLADWVFTLVVVIVCKYAWPELAMSVIFCCLFSAPGRHFSTSRALKDQHDRGRDDYDRQKDDKDKENRKG